MNSVLHPQFSPRSWAIVITIEVMLIFAAAGTGVVLYYQQQTQNSICTVFKYVGKQAQNGIDVNVKLVNQDIKLNTKASKADEAIRRQAIAKSTDFLVHLNQASC